MINVKVKNNRVIPFKKHSEDAGWDLRCMEDIFIRPGQTGKIHTGTFWEIPEGYAGIVVPRSGLGTKHKIVLANTVGVIDSIYRGEVIVFLTNNDNSTFELSRYERFCQMIVVPILLDQINIVDELSETVRGSGGFGHTGSV